MSIIKDAIEYLQQRANVPEILKQVEELDTANPLAVLPSHLTIQDLEKYMPNASHYRMAFATPSIPDFIAYGLANEIEGAACFVNADNMRANTIFDIGDLSGPGHKKHKSELSLTKTAAFRAMLSKSGESHSQKLAAEFIEDWSDNIVAIDNTGASMVPRAAANGLRDLSIESAREVQSQVGDFGESRSGMEKIEAKNQHLIPATLRFTCVPYMGLRERSFDIRVGILTGGETPTISYRVIQLEAAEEAMAEEFKGILVESFTGSGITTYIGNV